jgi:hypothetical protein
MDPIYKLAIHHAISELIHDMVFGVFESRRALTLICILTLIGSIISGVAVYQIIQNNIDNATIIMFITGLLFLSPIAIMLIMIVLLYIIRLFACIICGGSKPTVVKPVAVVDDKTYRQTRSSPLFVQRVS